MTDEKLRKTFVDLLDLLARRRMITRSEQDQILEKLKEPVPEAV